MSSIQGIKSVDFRITATGEGVVNHNGPARVYNPNAGQTVNNHMMPKLRGVDTMRLTDAPDNTGIKSLRPLSLGSPELANAALVVSDGCLRHALFKDVSFGVQAITRATAQRALASLHGLLRGYLITDNNASFARKSPLYLTQLHCEKPGLVYNQGSQSGARSETSLHSYFITDKNLEYTGYGSISIEELQFIPLENSLDRSAYSETITHAQGNIIAEMVTAYLQDLSGNLEAKVNFVPRAIRKHAFANNGEGGLLLNDAAIDVVVSEFLDMLRNLYIRQSKGFVQVIDVAVDYNNGRPMRILQNTENANSAKGELRYASYYNVDDITASAFDQSMLALEKKLKDSKEKKEKKKPAKKDASGSSDIAASSAESTTLGEASSTSNIHEPTDSAVDSNSQNSGE